MVPRTPRLDIAFAGRPVTLTFEMPLPSEHVLRGKSPADAVRLVGLVHNLCAQAHRAAARAACGLPAEPDSARTVMLEILREHLVVLCRSAPPLLGLEAIALPVAFSRLGAAYAPGGEAMRDSLSRALFGSAPGAAFSCEAFSCEALMAGSLLAPFFTALAAREAELGLDGQAVTLPGDPTFFPRVARDGGFVAPEGCGPLSERLLARLFEAHRLAGSFGTPAEEDYAARLVHPGVARVAAARGTLHHRAALEAGRITAYAIETPTDAMLGEGGPLATFLAALGRSRRADEAILRLGLLALDPCVPFEVTYSAADGRRLADA